MTGRRGRFTRCLTIAIVAALAGPFTATPRPASAAGKFVHVYDTAPTTYDRGCKGWIWASMGFMDTKGQAGADGTKVGDQIKVDGQVRGTVISAAGGMANGYADNAGNEAYDLSRGATLKQAWARLQPGDTFVICKHGAYHKHYDPKKQIDVYHQGGGIHLDKGDVFDGFRLDTDAKGKGTDTKQERVKPYPLPPPPTGEPVKVLIYACFSSKVPADGERSVVSTMEDIVGKGNVTGFDGEQKTGVSVGIDVQGAQNQQQADQLTQRAEDTLKKAAKEASPLFGAADGVGQWVLNQPLDKAQSVPQSALDADPQLKADGVTVTAVINWLAPHDPPVTVAPGDHAVTLPGGAATLYSNQLTAAFVLPPRSLPKSTTLIVLEDDATQLPPPAGETLTGPVTIAMLTPESGSDASVLDLPTRKLRRTGIVGFDLAPGTTGTPSVYRVANGTWRRLESAIDANGDVFAPLSRLGTLAAFATP